MYFLVSWPTNCQSRQVRWLFFSSRTMCGNMSRAFAHHSLEPGFCLASSWAVPRRMWPVGIPWCFLYPLSFTGLHQWESFADDSFKIFTLLLAFVILSCKGSLYTRLEQRNVGWSYLDSPLAGASRGQGCLDTEMLLSLACALRLSLHLRS